jgi:redox-sensitive bicupin YhaK (pirin superfamily)
VGAGQPREVRVVSSRMELEDVSGKVLFPTPTQGPWTPFLRFAETVTTGGGRDAEGHSHRREEVVNYVLEGRVEYEDDAGRRSPLEAGTVVLLTAREEARHNLVPRDALRTRWVSAIVRCSPTAGGPPHRVQWAAGVATPQGGDGVVERRLVGPQAPVVASSGLECRELAFPSGGACVCAVGGERRAVAYVLDGKARIGDQLVEAGSGALVENTNELSFEADAGARVFLASVPRD